MLCSEKIRYCEKCYGNGEFCKECDSGYFLYQNFDNQNQYNQCVKCDSKNQMQKGSTWIFFKFFPLKINYFQDICVECNIDHCSSCSTNNTSVCEQCKDGFYKVSNGDITMCKECKDDRIMVDGVCKKCQSAILACKKCKTVSKESVCTECESGYLISSKSLILKSLWGLN